MSYLEVVALEQDTPTDDDWDKAILHPDQIPVVSFHHKLFTTQVIAELCNSKV